ncbi:hypothetical protein SCHPADRAFT_571574 [Schizopora paradoxa]|uniref:MYND-type domain-containing protein n=1 Tax=Schizopora paradoxa TaxID=27342 RepID=A0A0H2RIR8_9AGAM|nr:hypothetical protein SCHPADRAFT_571574 [Schizopora paradoxa]
MSQHLKNVIIWSSNLSSLHVGTEFRNGFGIFLGRRWKDRKTPLAYLRCFDGVRQVVDDTPGVLKLTTLLWLQHQKLSTLRPSGCMLMSSFIGERIVKKRSFDEILDAVDGDPVVIIEALLEPFRQFLEKPTSSSEGRAIASIIFLYQLTRRPKHILCRRLLQKNAVPLVLSFLLKWIQNPLLQSSDKRSVVSDSFKFFDGLAYCAPGVTWVIQAFRAGLLEFYVRTWPIIADMPRKDIDLLLHCFTCVSMRYLHDLQVVETARDALAKDLNVQGVDVDWHAEDDDQQPEYQTPLGTLIMFRDLLQKRVNVAEDIPYGTIRKNCQICDFCLNYESTLMACQGCRQAFYCSKTCQSQGWKVGGHRDKCRKMRWRKEPNRSLVKDIQLLFLKTVVVYEMASFADKFFPCEFMVRKRYRPGEEIENFIVEADFWATPGGNVSVDIQGGDIRFDEEEAAESGALSGSIQPEVQEVKLSKKATGHILVTQPHGEDKQEAYITTSDLWHDLQRFSGLKEPPTIIIRRP